MNTYNYTLKSNSNTINCISSLVVGTVIEVKIINYFKKTKFLLILLIVAEKILILLIYHHHYTRYLIFYINLNILIFIWHFQYSCKYFVITFLKNFSNKIPNAWMSFLFNLKFIQTKYWWHWKRIGNNRWPPNYLI